MQHFFPSFCEWLDLRPLLFSWASRLHKLFHNYKKIWVQYRKFPIMNMSGSQLFSQCRIIWGNVRTFSTLKILFYQKKIFLRECVGKEINFKIKILKSENRYIWYESLLLWYDTRGWAHNIPI